MPYPQPLESFQMFPRIVQNLQNNQENLACDDSKLKSSNDFLNFNKLTNEKKNIYILEYNHINTSCNKCNQCLIFMFKYQNCINVENIYYV